MHYRQLAHTPLKVSILGFGAATLGNEYGATDRKLGARAVAHAIEHGINFFDVSPYYGRTLAEERLGEALVGYRDRIVLATKCGRYDVAQFDFRRAAIKQSLEASLRRLRTDRIDLFELHDVEFVPAEILLEEALPALLELKQEGKCQAIGITGYPLGHLQRLIAASPVPLDCVLSYARFNLLCNDLRDTLLPYAVERGMSVINASPLFMGALTPQGPPSWHKADPEILAVARSLVSRWSARGWDVPTIALHYALSESRIASTLIGLSTPDEVDQALRALEFEMSLELMSDWNSQTCFVRNRPWIEGLAVNNP